MYNNEQAARPSLFFPSSFFSFQFFDRRHVLSWSEATQTLGGFEDE